MMNELKQTNEYEFKTIKKLFKINKEQGNIGKVYQAYQDTLQLDMYTQLMDRELNSANMEYLINFMMISDGMPIYKVICDLYSGPDEQPMLGRLFAEIERTVEEMPMTYGNFTDVMSTKPYWQYFMNEINEEVFEMDFETFNATLWGENEVEMEDEPEEE